MLKNILVTLFIIPVIGAAIYGYFYFKQIKTPVSPVIQAIPVNAAVIVKCNNAKSMLQNFSMSNPAWKALAEYPSFGEMHSEIKKLDALFPTSSEALKSIQDNPLFISAHPIGSSGFECLFLTNLPNTVTKKYVDAFVKNSASKETVFNLKIYDGIALNELKISETSSFFYFFSRGIFACSFSQMLMEDAIRQLNSGVSISTDMAFEKVWNAAGKKVDATIFVNYEYLSQTIDSYVNQKESQFIKPLASFANWTSLDVKWKATTIQLNGFTCSKDSTNNYLNIFKNQEPQEIDLVNEMPASTAYFMCYAFSDVNLFFKNYNNYIGNLTDHFKQQETLIEFNKKYGVNAVNFFQQWLGNQYAYIITEPTSLDYSENCYAIFKTNGNKDVKNSVYDFAKKVNGKENSSDTIAHKFRGFDIMQLHQQNFIPMVLGDNFSKLKNTFFVFMDDNIVFANSSLALKKWINTNSSEHRLKDDNNYQSFSESLSTKANIFYYSALARSSNLFQQNFKNEIVNWNEAKDETVKGFHAVAFQLSANQNLFYTTAFAEYKPCYTNQSDVIMETELDSTAHTKPFVLTDPADSTTKLLVQDDALTIYLISNTGEILWKKEMKEKIVGDASGLQSAKDNKLQILFSTKTKIYLLDEDGDNVAHFPVALKYTATNGVQAFDYDNNHDYRFLIAEENNRIHNYTPKGEPVNGWEATVNAAQVSAPVKYFGLGGKDYIVVLDKMGTVNLLDRKGKSQFKFKQKLRNAYRNNFYVDVASTLNNSSILACDSTGEITRLYFSGKTENTQFKKTNEPFYFNYFSGKETPAYFFTFKNKIEKFEKEQKPVITIKTNNAELTAPFIFEQDNNEYGIALSNAADKLQVYSGNGNKIKESSFSITAPLSACHFFGDSSWYIVAVGGKKVRVIGIY